MFAWKSLTAIACRMGRDRSGNIATMFAIMVIPLIGLVGAAIDYSNAYRAKSRIQNALDATSLAVNRSIGTIPEKDLKKMAEATFLSNMGSGISADLSKIDIKVTDREVTLAATTHVKTLFMALLGVENMAVGASSRTVTGLQTFEIALALDNSGSMYGSKIRDLRDAARALTDTMFAGKDTSDTVKISVVPFAAAVNVGPQYRNASWIDGNGVSPIHSENFTTTANRFQLFDNIANAKWKGCVESRPQPLDVEDTTPDPSVPESYFVPMFAPDEPDSDNAGGEPAYNNYLDDNVSSKGKGKGKGKGGPTWAEAQGNTGKYKPGITAAIRAQYGTEVGPNFLCDSNPITALTNRKSDIVSALNTMNAYGGTNIHEGVMWGWRTLTANAPFTEGLPDGTQHNHKIIVLMTDGENQMIGLNNENKSMYSAYGFASQGRLRPPTSSSAALKQMMDERTQRACRNAKRAGILIYTILFDFNNGETRELLKNCASDKDKAFTADNGSELIATFQKIASELSALRIAE